MTTTFLLVLLITVALSTHAFRPTPSISTSTLCKHKPLLYSSQPIVYSIRGGDVDITDSDDDDDDDDYLESDEEEKEIEQEIEKLSASAKKVIEKSKDKKKAKIKQTVSESLKVSKKKKSSGTSVLKKIPYILRAFMNPFTVFAMTKGYFASLFNIDYLQQDISQSLRSALQEKAKSSPPGGGGAKKARKMKPGQAKTLSDLPQLSA
mmetsp:Transcript_7721/g.14565  ORF Transcript_7721/g.14565 Transcript_7721/m.14565 type:complete len:207 (-) Transcript_7721:497-1117(-)|eukprot:CAMPEP_0176493814 /NCGR_PEP_ID=MMETSP0200_2-20121128/9745_1 /TAXON_ID=947934 /ORGANISM="Chaetoceros sp., Strain GSL56" /LENGTH=206 /DNA_ID=CAMNT_0017891493 /DNA_START=240 /DNA_END=860 /DNA_ORIENTATION=+